jgi:NAD(P)-dependent dehydrogenase (short-subunit alcohol dehydrogenase family)
MTPHERKTVVLTGATRGIGRALADALIGHGHVVAGCGRSTDQIQVLRASHASPHRFDAVDVADWGQVRDWAGTVLESVSPPDLLVNNAGVINGNAPLWEIDDVEFSQVMSVNVGGTANVIRAFLPAMIDRGSGVVVNMSSGWGRSTAPEVAPYCASKWAIEGLTQALSQELPPGLAAVALNPGVIDTEMLRSCWGGSASSCPSPEDWARRAAPFLLSLTADHNGQALTV